LVLMVIFRWHLSLDANNKCRSMDKLKHVPPTQHTHAPRAYN